MILAGIAPSEVRQLSNITRLAMLHEIRRQRARRRLEFIGDLRAALADAKDDDAKERMAQLAVIAYEGDEITLAEVMSSITR